MTPRTAVLVGLNLLVASQLAAQDVQPRVYTPAPVGVNLATMSYAFSSGTVLFDKTIPVENANAHIHSIAAAYSRSTGVFGMASRVDIVLPFVVGDWEGDIGRTVQSTSQRGFGDPMLRLGVFLVGAPALTRVEFAQFQPRTIVGATLRVSLPLGQYDANMLVNLGSNRWRIGPQLGVSHVTAGFLWEAYASAWFFTENREFLGTSTLSQDPLFTFQVHLVYRFKHRFWLAVSSRQSLGGATKVDGGDKLDPETNNRVGITLALPVASKYTLKFMATTGLTTTVGNDYTSVAAAWQMVF